MAINLKYKFKSYTVLNLIQGAHPQTLKVNKKQTLTALTVT